MRPILKKIIIWIIINITISAIFSIIKSMNSHIPGLILFSGIIIITFIISSLSVLAGYCTILFMRGKSYIIEIPAVLIAVLFAATAGNAISQYMVKFLPGYTVNRSVLDNLLLILLITVTVTVITIMIEHLSKMKKELEENINDIKNKIKNEHDIQSISVKNEDGYNVINFSDLVYLSSHGKKTSFHTADDVCVVNMLLKNIEKNLPSDMFIRIHKQHIININYLKQMRYYEGGRYTAYLNDDDESVIPVGRYIAPVLKEKLGL